MLQIHRQSAYALIALLNILFMTACNNDKAAQCHSFAQTNAQVRASLAKHEAIGQALNQKQTTDLAGFTALAKEYADFYANSAQDIDKAFQIIQALNVQDQQLKSFQRDYANITKQAGENSHNLSKITANQSVITAQDLTNGKLQKLRQEFKQVSGQLTTNGEEEKQLMEKFNAYCGIK